MSVTISPVKNKAGMVVGAAVVARDITRQKQAEAALRLSDERFRVALKNARVVVFTQDLQLRYTWINSPIPEWERQDAVGQTDDELIGGAEGTRLTAIKQEVLRTGVGSRTEFTVTSHGVKRKRAAERDLSALVEASEDAIIGKTLDGTIVSWNRGAKRTYGYKAEEMLGNSITALIPPGKPNEFPAIVRRLQRGQSIKSFETTRLHRDNGACILPDGVVVSASPSSKREHAIVIYSYQSGFAILANTDSFARQRWPVLPVKCSVARKAHRAAPCGLRPNVTAETRDFGGLPRPAANGGSDAE